MVTQAPHNTSGMTKRIYRTLSTAEGTEYHYAGAIPATAASFDDKASDEVVALGEILPSTGWDMPPADMKGIVILANGIAAGFRQRSAFFRAIQTLRMADSLPADLRPGYRGDRRERNHAGRHDTGNPFTITGVEPVTMGGGMEKLGVAWPCMAKRGVASFAFGVGYPAPQGMVIIGANSDIVTKDLFTQKEWSELNPGTFIAASADNRYYCGYSGG